MFIYHKVPKGKPRFTIADFIPQGRNNAIPRQDLINVAIEKGLIGENIKDKGRALRLLIEKDRRDFVILNLSNGDGYYRVGREDCLDLQKYIRQEESRAKACFKNIKMAKALYEDLIHGRKEIEEG